MDIFFLHISLLSSLCYVHILCICALTDVFDYANQFARKKLDTNILFMLI